MKTYTNDEQANFQINAIKSMLERGFSDIEIAASFNNMGEKNLAPDTRGWTAKDIRSIATNFKLDHSILASSSAAAKPKTSIVPILFCVLGGAVAIWAGLSLTFINGQAENTMLEAIANGIGLYCIGKGIFMIASPFLVNSDE